MTCGDTSKSLTTLVPQRQTIPFHRIRSPTLQSAGLLSCTDMNSIQYDNMKRRPLILIALIVILPLTALTWAALRIAESEKIVVHQRFRELMEDRLHDVNANVATFFENTERSLNQITAIDHFDVDKLRQVIRSQPSMLQMFVLNPSGQITYPDPGNMESLNGRERLFLVQAAKMFTGKDLKEAVVRSEHGTNVASDVVEVDGNPAASGQRRSSTSSRTLPSPAPHAVQELQAQQQIQAPSQLVEDAYSVAQVQNIAEFTESSGGLSGTGTGD